MDSPSQRPVARSFVVFFDVHLKQTTEQTVDIMVIWDALALIVTAL